MAGKASGVKTVGVYIGLFVLANVTKGPVVLYANKAYYTRLNNFGHDNVVTVVRGQDEQDADRGQVGETKSVLSLTTDSRAYDASSISLVELKTSTEWTRVFPTGFRIYTKSFLRGRDAKETFCFAKTDEWNQWMMAANAIKNAYIFYRPQHGWDRSKHLLQLPLYLWHPDESGGRAEFHSLLLLAIDGIKFEDLFWSLGMEVIMVLTDNYNSHLLCSESLEATKISILASLVYSCVRMLLSEYAYCGDV